MSLLEITSKIQNLKKNISKDLVTLGKILCDVRDKELYLEQCETFNEFIATPEISISHATAYKSMRVYEVYVKQLCLPDVAKYDQDKLYRASSVITLDNKDEWLNKIEALSRSDLAIEVRETKGLPEWDSSRSTNEWVKEFLYEVCPRNNIEPAELELEELLSKFYRFIRRKQ